MLIATIVNKRIFSCQEYLAAFAVCLGLVVFAAADWTVEPSLNVIGISLVSGSVCADAFLPNAQEKLFRLGSSRLEVTVYTNLFALSALTITTFMSGDLLGIINHASEDNNLATLMIVYIGISYFAITTYMNIVKKFGGVSAVLLATARKGMSLVLSFLFFPKKFSWLYVSGAVLVLGGLVAASILKQMASHKAATEPTKTDPSLPQPPATPDMAKLERKNSFPETLGLLGANTNDVNDFHDDQSEDNQNHENEVDLQHHHGNGSGGSSENENQCNRVSLLASTTSPQPGVHKKTIDIV